MQFIQKGGMPIISQLLSYIPEHLLHRAIADHNSDKGYKKLKTKQQLAYMLCGIVGKLESLNGLIKSLPFLGTTLSYFGITEFSLHGVP